MDCRLTIETDTKHQVQQAADDPPLLELMIDDLSRAPAEFQPTNYWAGYTQRFIGELRQRGLRDFRRQSDTVFRAFGAVDFVNPVASIALSKNRFLKHLPASLQRRIDKWAAQYVTVTDGLDLESYVLLGFHFARACAQGSNAKPIELFSNSLVGNPEGLITINGNFYSRQSIQYYLQYAYVSRLVDFDQLSVVAEIGSGMGRQTEIFAQLHPQLTLLLFDLPPQIYVAEQFLKSAFPDRVVSYRETRTRNDLNGLKPGKIYIFGNYHAALMTSRPIDLFWNSASFHEMEPDVVERYLSLVDKSARWAYLSENLSGGVKAKRPGDPGILKVTTRDDYVGSLPSMELVDSAPTPRINGKPLKDTSLMFARRSITAPD